MDFVGKRYWFILISLLVILPGVVFLIIAPGLKPGIDFTGGSSLTVQFTDPVRQADLRSKLGALGYPDAIVQNLGENTFFIRTKELDEAQRNSIVDGLKASLSPGGLTLQSFDLVSALVARETIVDGLWAVLAASVAIFFYIWWAFRNVPSPFRYGAAAIIALVHDVLVVVGVFAILGVLADVEVNTMFLVALLTIIGYSVNDTIVVFDRLRENVTLNPSRSLAENVNLSISDTLGRSLNTSLAVFFTVLALLLFGGPTLREFLLVLLVGVVAGSYSSIAIAAPLLVIWENGEIGKGLRRLLGRGRSPQPAAAR